MNPNDLREEIAIELEAMKQTLDELTALLHDVTGRQATTRELAAAGLFLANLYNAVENILKRICKYHSVDIPAGPNWHMELARSFSDPPNQALPTLLNEKLARDLAPYRQFRHVVHHGYGFQLKWQDMLPGINGAKDVMSRFQKAVEAHLKAIDSAVREE